MNTAIAITAIICGTIVIICVLDTINEAIKRKNPPKNLFDVLGMTNKEDK